MDRQLKWDTRYINLAREVATWSKDPSTKVGAVLVRRNNSVASTGFNGFPPGHDDSPELYRDREYKYEHVIHAEINALQFLGETAKGMTSYTSFPSCPDCVKALGEAGVRRIVTAERWGVGKSSEWLKEWRLRVSKSKRLARDEFGMEWEVISV